MMTNGKVIVNLHTLTFSSLPNLIANLCVFMPIKKLV